MMQVRELMSKHPVTVSAADTIQHAAKLMRDQRTGMVVVTSPPSMLEGVLTDRDIVVRCVALGLDPNRAVVGEHIERHPISIDAGADVSEAVAVVKNAGVRRLVVTEAGRCVVGVLSIDDLALDAKQYIDALLAESAHYSKRSG